MDFLDKLSKSMTEAGHKTIAKTKEIADTSRLNSMIYDEEKIINNKYSEIGKLYVSLHKEDYEDAFADMINAITQAKVKIKDYKKQIQDIKGVQRCNKCGAEVQSGAAFCSACGSIMEAENKENEAVQEPTEEKKCQSCGKTFTAEMAFCSECGTKLS